MLSLLYMLAAAEPVVVAPPQMLQSGEADCSLVIEEDGVKSVTAPIAGLKVQGGPETLAVTPPGAAKLLGVRCHRASIVPVAGDDRVIRQLGVPLYITTGQLTAVLKLAGGSFVYRPLGVAWDESIQPQIDAVLAQFNARLGG